ncbi:MAG: hypothetical protein K2N71_02165 [Oscillospiraceae bacterium]|nr:hypothetical protein [Oscillospiraceae bacterium]
MVTEENVEKNICIRYDLSDRKVSVLSDIYLDNFFKGKEIENVLFYSATSKTVKIILSIFFTVINVTVSIFTIFLDSHYLISSAILVCVYIASTVILKKKTSLEYDEIAFIQFGGIAVFIAILLMYIVLAIFNGFIVAVIITAEYFKSVIIPLALNMIFFGLLRLIINAVKIIKNKLKGEDNHESKNRYQTRN